MAKSTTSSKTTSPNQPQQQIRWKRNFPYGVPPMVRWRIYAIAFLGVLLVYFSLVILNTVRIPYFALSPGEVIQVQDSVNISESSTYPSYRADTQGEFGYVTARVTTQLTPMAWLNHTLIEESRILHNKVLGEDATEPEVRRSIGQIEIRNSQNTAVLLAFELLGIEIPEKESGLRIVEIQECADANNVLQLNDIIFGVGDIPTLSGSALGDVLGTKNAGDSISLNIQRNGETIEGVEVLLLSRTDPCLFELFSENQGVGLEGSPAIGITVSQIIELMPPIDVTFDTGDIGGSSAGLAFTLGLIDLLEPGDLSGGKRIAATGAISIDGSVSDIGGIPEKLSAVKSQGYDIFFIPEGQRHFIEGRNTGDVQVVEVTNISQALAVLEEMGGDPLDKFSPNIKVGI